jgi:hypothetical protein
VETAEKTSYRKPSHRQLGMRMDPVLEQALEASARKNERRLAEEARYAIRLYLGIPATPEPVTDARQD